MSRVAITTMEEVALGQQVIGSAASDPKLMRFIRRQLTARVHEAIDDGFFEADEANELIAFSVATVAHLPAFWVRYKMLNDLPDHAFGNA